MNEKSKKCPSCDGTGIGQELDHDDECVSMTMYREIDCRECNGKGYIIKKEKGGLRKSQKSIPTN